MPLEEITRIDLAIKENCLSPDQINEIKTLSPKQYERINNIYALFYLKHKWLSISEILALDENQYNRLMSCQVVNFISDGTLTLQEAKMLDSRRAKVLTSFHVDQLLCNGSLDVKTALRLNHRFEFLWDEEEIEDQILEGLITPEQAIHLHRAFQKFPEFRCAYLSGQLSYDQIMPYYAVKQLDLGTVLLQFLPKIQQAYLRQDEPLPLVPQTFSQFGAINVEMKTFRWAMLWKRNAIIERLPKEISGIRGSSHLVDLNADYCEILFNSPGHQQYCQSMIQLSFKFFRPVGLRKQLKSLRSKPAEQIEAAPTPQTASSLRLTAG